MTLLSFLVDLMLYATLNVERTFNVTILAMGMRMFIYYVDMFPKVHHEIASFY